MILYTEICCIGDRPLRQNKSEIDVKAGDLRIEIKTARPRRGYPKDVKVLSEKDIPAFPIALTP